MHVITATVPNHAKAVSFVVKLSLLVSFSISGFATSFHSCANLDCDYGQCAIAVCCSDLVTTNQNEGTEDLLKVNDIQSPDCGMCHLISQLQVAASLAAAATSEPSESPTGRCEDFLHTAEFLVQNSARGPPSCTLPDLSLC
ncbi:MAG: hypothetical protein P8L78_02905 [Mariniblastus sp.]|nr:hypothetical protein [Mariniblastus sp.]MDG2180616.1 hypothetical protein [Mariniblastus sp.]